MALLTQIKKEQLCNYISKGISLNQISSKLGIPKSTAYYYYRKLKYKKYKKPEYSIKFSEIEGEIVGIFAGDGSQYHYKKNGNYTTTIHFGNVIGYISHVRKLYNSFFGKSWNLWRERTKEGFIRHRLRAYNKEIFNFFYNYLNYDSTHKYDTCEVKSINFPEEFKIGFLRGFFDTDGHLSTSSNRLRAFYYTTSKKLATQMQIFFNDLNIKTIIWQEQRKDKKCKDLFILRVAEKEVNNFLNKIRPYRANKLGR